MAAPDSFLVFIKSSLHFNFAVLVSSHDDIASLKRKAEAQHQDLFPDTGRILARAIKIIQKGTEYTVVDSCPVICFVDRAKCIGSFLMDAVVLPPITPQTCALICGPGDPSGGRYLIEGVSCTLQSLKKRKYVEDNTSKYAILENEETIRVDDLVQCARDKGNKKSKKLSSDEVLRCSEGVSANKGDLIREFSAASENEIVGVPLNSGSSLAGSPGDAYGERYLIEGGLNFYCTSDSFQKKFLEDNANKDRAVEEDATLEDNSSIDRAAEENVTLEDNANNDRAVEDDVTLEDNSSNDRAAEEVVTLEDNANKNRAVEEDATLEENSKMDRAAKEDASLEDNANKDRAVEKDATFEDNSSDDRAAEEDATLENNVNKKRAAEEDATLEDNANMNRAVEEDATLEDNANKNRAVEEDATLEDNANMNRAVEEDATLEDNANKNRAVEEDATLEDNSNKDRAAEEDASSEDNANKAMEKDASLDKESQKKSKDVSSNEFLTGNERGVGIREIQFSSENEASRTHLKSFTSLTGDAYSDIYLMEGGLNPYCTSDSFQKKFLEDNANKDRDVEEDATLKDNSSNDMAAEEDAEDNSSNNRTAEEDATLEDNANKNSDAKEDATLKDNANKNSAAEEDETMEDNSNKDRPAEEDASSEDNANKAVEKVATLDKESQKKSMDASSDEFLMGNERGVGIREIQFSSENEASRTHLKSFTSLTGLPSEDMPSTNAHSLGHLAEKLACATPDKGKSKFLPSVSSSSCSGSSSPNYNRAETNKIRRHGMALHEACTSRLHSRAIRVENLGGEERNGLCRENYMTMEESGFTSEDLEDEFARINQIESDEILARSLQDEFNLEHQTLAESDEEANCFMEQFLSQERYMQIPECRRAQMRFNGPAMDHENLLISQLLHEYQKPEVDNPKREELLVELIATNESRADTEFFDGFDFYQDLFYDEDESVQMPNQTEGLTESQINHLPVSEIQDDNEDACIICLETPSIGSVMRHLPCFHKFHKECVDVWLLIRNSCPVCKLAIH